MNIQKQIAVLIEILEKHDRDSETTYLKTMRLKNGKRAHLTLTLKEDTEEDHREYLEYKREIMEQDERSAAREAAREE